MARQSRGFKVKFLKTGLINFISDPHFWAAIHFFLNRYDYNQNLAHKPTEYFENAFD